MSDEIELKNGWITFKNMYKHLPSERMTIKLDRISKIELDEVADSIHLRIYLIGCDKGMYIKTWEKTDGNTIVKSAVDTYNFLITCVTQNHKCEACKEKEKNCPDVDLIL